MKNSDSVPFTLTRSLVRLPTVAIGFLSFFVEIETPKASDDFHPFSGFFEVFGNLAADCGSEADEFWSVIFRLEIGFDVVAEVVDCGEIEIWCFTHLFKTS